jgi:hypothetical protein
VLERRGNRQRTMYSYFQNNGNYNSTGLASQGKARVGPFSHSIEGYADIAFALPTRLTQTGRSLASAGKVVAGVPATPKTQPRCPVCGTAVTTGSTYCAKCIPAVNRENISRQAKLGRIATHNPIAEARRAATHAKHVEALRKWNPSDLPEWLDEVTYKREILPRLAKFTVKAIRLALDVSHPYATLLKQG